MQIDNIDEATNLLNDISVLFNELDNVKKILEDHIRQKEAEQEDYLHELELGNLNGIEIMQTSKKLIKARKERRVLKDKLELINTLKGYTDKFINKGIIGETIQAIKNINTLKENQKNRKYTARIIQNLKCTKQENKND